MTKDEIKTLLELVEGGANEDDIVDYCEEQGLNACEFFEWFADNSVPIACKGCENATLYPSLPPCPCCSRGKADLYKPRKAVVIAIQHED